MVEAFRESCRGFSVDRVIADPILNDDFQAACAQRSLPGGVSDRNRFLFRLRKSGRLKRAGIETTAVTDIGWSQIDTILEASEVAWRSVADLYSASLDDIFCDPRLASEFDRLAANLSPGRSPLEYRWAALKLRKETGVRKKNLERAAPDVVGLLKADAWPLDEIQSIERFTQQAGVYSIESLQANHRPRYLYIGETLRLRSRLQWLENPSGREAWQRMAEGAIQLRVLPAPLNVRLANQLALLKKTKGSSRNCSSLREMADQG
jgi:site-specific DNA-methyltransferase (adenine-specific)